MIREGLQQSDLIVRERPDLEAANCDGADRTARPQERNANNGSSPFLPRARGSLREFVYRRLSVGNVDKPSLDRGPPVRGPRNQWKGADGAG